MHPVSICGGLVQDLISQIKPRRYTGGPVPNQHNKAAANSLFRGKWDVTPDGKYDSIPLVVPGRQNFGQGGVYRMKLTNIAGREGVELYPTLEVAPMTRRSASYLAHSAIPIQFTDEDFDQVMAGNFVTKVIYIPDPEFQALA